MIETLCQMFQESVLRFSDRPALLRKVGGRFQPITYREMGARVRAMATALLALGIGKQDRVAILSENRPEWTIADFGILHIGAVTVGIFPTLPAGQVEYTVADSDARVLIVSDQEQLAKALAVKKSLPELLIISLDSLDTRVDGVLSLEELMAKTAFAPLSDAAYEAYWRSVGPRDWASIIYTSGTTADPRGAILSHWNFVSDCASSRLVIAFQPDEVLLSLVPLNHVYGRMVDEYLAISAGSTVAYAESLRRLRENMVTVSPHYMVLVPRVLEMFQEGLLAAVSKEPAYKQKLFAWAFGKGMELTRRVQAGKRLSLLLTLQAWLGDQLVFKKIRKRLGLDRLKFFFAGGAPLSKQTGEFFSALRLAIMEGYGLTETSPVVAVNPPGRLRFGSVGRPISGVEVKLADDGEILVRGPNVMQGYHKRPAETEEAIDLEGWFHTGDIGEFNEDGYLTITDRKKNLIVLANGKNVAPQHLENRLLESHLIHQVVIVGDQQKTIGALIVPAFDRIREWAEKEGIDSMGTKELARAPEVQRLIRQEIRRLSADVADYEKVRRFALLDQEFTVEGGEVTPTLKIKRRVILERYREVIDSLYKSQTS